jgi:hypothetical protein
MGGGSVMLTDQRKKELDQMTEEDVYYFWNIFTEEENKYIKLKEKQNKEVA